MSTSGTRGVSLMEALPIWVDLNAAGTFRSGQSGDFELLFPGHVALLFNAASVDNRTIRALDERDIPPRSQWTPEVRLQAIARLSYLAESALAAERPDVANYHTGLITKLAKPGNEIELHYIKYYIASAMTGSMICAIEGGGISLHFWLPDDEQLDDTKARLAVEQLPT